MNLRFMTILTKQFFSSLYFLSDYIYSALRMLSFNVNACLDHLYKIKPACYSLGNTFLLNTVFPSCSLLKRELKIEYSLEPSREVPEPSVYIVLVLSACRIDCAFLWKCWKKWNNIGTVQSFNKGEWQY